MAGRLEVEGTMIDGRKFIANLQEFQAGRKRFCFFI
jgi:hypothetical protein